LYAACVHVAGEGRFNRRGEQIALQRGDVFITDSRQEFTLDLDRPWQHLLITLPTEWLDARIARPELLAGAILRGHPLVRLWTNHLASGFDLASEFSPTAAALFSRHSVELLVQLIEEVHHDEFTPSEAWRAAVFMGACQVIARKVGDVDLSPDEVAREMNVSTRTLERVFAANGQTIMRHVLGERLRQAAAMLSAPKAVHRTVAEIAFACGFRDASHFGRAFAAKTGMTPTKWRLRQQ
jgi:AraC-like DNA-binding protein